MVHEFLHLLLKHDRADTVKVEVGILFEGDEVALESFESVGASPLVDPHVLVDVADILGVLDATPVATDVHAIVPFVDVREQVRPHAHLLVTHLAGLDLPELVEVGLCLLQNLFRVKRMHSRDSTLVQLVRVHLVYDPLLLSLADVFFVFKFLE